MKVLLFHRVVLVLKIFRGDFFERQHCINRLFLVSICQTTWNNKDVSGLALGTPPMVEALISASRILLEMANRSSCSGADSSEVP
jgi:hypothetical protein